MPRRSGIRGRVLRLGRTGRLAVLVALGVVLLVGAGGWGLSADRGGHGESAPDWAAVPGARLKIVGLTNAEVDHSKMKGMAQMAGTDEVPEGFTRLKVSLELAATEGELVWRQSDFVLSTSEGVRVLPIQAELGDGLIPDNARVSGSLTFEVPEQSQGLSLSFRSSAALEVPSSGLSHDAANTDAEDGSGTEEPGHHERDPGGHEEAPPATGATPGPHP